MQEESVMTADQFRGEGPTKLFHRILVATDFSAASTPAFEQSVKIAKGCGAQLSIAHAYDATNIIELGFVPASAYQKWDKEFRADIEKRLRPLVEYARQEGVDAAALVLTGLPDKAIVEAAQRDGADLIIMGTHGRRGVTRLFLGSVAARVISTAPCPVMTVRPA